IAHGIDMERGLDSQKAAVDSGQWLLYRYNPDLLLEGKNPLQLDSKAPKIPVAQYMQMENRFRMLAKSKPEDAKRFAAEAQKDAEARWSLYHYLAERPFGSGGGEGNA
ncbi:MAG: hypothetical protein EHM19_11095, partial [Candidatus Latescibacterota bacterium]